MSDFAEEAVKKYIRTNLAMFFRIRVSQMIYLPCFTDMDRQELTAYHTLNGNDRTVWEFFQRLQCRKGWLEILIKALQEYGLEDLAVKLQQVYDTNLLPAQHNASLTASSPAVGNPPPPMRSSAVGFSPPASVERMASPPRDPSRGGAQASPRFVRERQGAAPSIPNPDSAEMSSYHAPVQETDETVAEPKVTHDPRNLEYPTLPIYAQALPYRVPAAERRPTNAQAPAAPSSSHALYTQDHTLPGTSLPMPSEASASTQQWNSHRQRPVCVRNGYFGNASRVTMDSGASPALAGPLGPKSPGNQPVEDFYMSADSSPSAGPSSRDDSQEEESLQEENTRAPSHSVERNSRTFNLQRQKEPPPHSGAESSTAEQLSESGRGGATDRGRNSPTKKDDSETPMVVRPRNFQGRGDHVVTTATPRLPSGAPQLGSSLSSRPLRLWHPSENVNVSPNPSAVLLSGFGEFSSTGVIPPSSHPSAPSGVDFEDPKAPIQEKKWPAGGDADTSTLEQDKVSRVRQPLCTVNPRKRKNGSSCISKGSDDGDDDDDDLCKPGVLISVAETSSPVQLSNDPETVYSGRSERLCLSSLGEDPLIMSDLNQSDPPREQHSGSALGAVLGKNVTGERGDASLQPSYPDHEVSGSVRTYEVQVGKDASVDLAAAPNIIGSRRRQMNQSSPDCPDLAIDRSPITPANSYGSEASIPNDASPPRIPSDYKFLLVGLAVAAVAAMAFALYKRK